MAGGFGAEEPPPPPPPPPSQHPPLNGGEFLLRLVQRTENSSPASPSLLPPHAVSLDPAVAAVGPTIPLPIDGHRHLHHHDRPSSLPAWPHAFPPSDSSISPPFPPNFFRHGFPQSPPLPHQHFLHHHHHQPPSHSPPARSSLLLNAATPHLQFNNNLYQRQHQDNNNNNNNNNNTNVLLGQMPLHVSPDEGSSDSRSKFNLSGASNVVLAPVGGAVNGLDANRGVYPRRDLGSRTNDGAYESMEVRQRGPPPGFSGKTVNGRLVGLQVEHNMAREISSPSDFRSNHIDLSHSGKHHYGRGRSSRDGQRSGEMGLSEQIDHPGLPAGTAAHSVLPFEIESEHAALRAEYGNKTGFTGRDDNFRSSDNPPGRDGHDEIADLSEHLEDSLVVEDEHGEKKEKKKHNHRDKDFRTDPRGKFLLSQRMRSLKRLNQCRSDIHRMNSHFLHIFKSLIPSKEEKEKQKQLLTLLEKLVSKEWPNAKLYLYGSCANTFGVSKSDIDICLAINEDVSKSEVILKLADILQSDNLENVQALTRARVPIVKLKDPATGISCDICINNVLAVVNTKLLRDYAEIDERLRQLAFIVKHWAKSRGVNETYQGTLSSYAYVLMCIHCLQQRRPPILPCLQGMEPTYRVSVDGVDCAYFDEVEKLRHFGAQNTESIAQLVWAFFNYWAYGHDYANSVISVRRGSTISKQAKDWTRRIGNDRHLICIEDPFETSHDLGRVVDKYSIRVLREEFERAAEIMQCDPNPFVELFKPYVPS